MDRSEGQDPVQPRPIPAQPQRIGDAERDQAAERLRENLALGRLDQSEFDERLETALQARYASDLEPLFADLPDSGQLATTSATDTPVANPYNAATPHNVATQHNRGILSPRAVAAIEAVSWVIWPIMIGLITFAGWGNFWWLVFVPIGLSTAWRAYRQHDVNEAEQRNAAQPKSIEDDRDHSE